MGAPRYCIHGTKINDPCPECFKEAGQAPGCAACDAKDTEIRQQAERIKQLEGAKPEWVVNSLGELGVKVSGRYFFHYKGRSLEYDEPDEDGPILARLVNKREFGECVYPISFKGRIPSGRYDAPSDPDNPWVEICPALTTTCPEPKKHKCPDCDDGTIRDESRPMGEQWLECPTCHGTGESPPTCPECGGIKEIHRCQECGEIANPVDSRWRTLDGRWAHHHGHQVGHVQADCFGSCPTCQKEDHANGC